MKNVLRIVTFLVISVLFSACKGTPASISKRQQTAEQQMTLISQAIVSGNLDSVWIIARQSKDATYYVYSDEGLVFWSDNSLAINDISLKAFETWYEQQVDNALCLFRWAKVGDYRLLAVLPIKWQNFDKKILADSFSFRALEDNDATTSLWQSSRLRA